MDWRPFPYGDRAYRYAGSALSEQWSRLHRGDREPFPDPERVAERINRCGRALVIDTDPNRLANGLQSAWRDYHAGDFGTAIRTAQALGPIGAVVAARAQIAYATYLENNDREALALLCAAARLCEDLTHIDPGCANAWFLHALALGRYSQRISVVKALARGLGGKIHHSLNTALALEPSHAAAYATLGVYHFEVIDKVGTVVGRVTHGASREAGLRCFEKALSLDPDSPVTRMEFAHVLSMGRRHDNEQAVEHNMTAAATCQPFDALARLDVERARTALSSV
ncbi:hypothetical protein G3580_09730 [Nitrogeniibacter mangrovi]|uniref:Tetratricopeptide repeat protein n=2 Tax=Nitrogeniibacter mangrovi TaxID=2016596 RepID=A0A6C1B8T3_9RHOO|nr:hypothetical protein G3580_09730 [Nitrogeniibacter mangrovi]